MKVKRLMRVDTRALNDTIGAGDVFHFKAMGQIEHIGKFLDVVAHGGERKINYWEVARGSAL